VLLPAANPVQARRVADVLAEAVREHAPLVGGQPVKLSTSIGIACFGHGTADPDQLLAAADLAMYEAKEAGRDRVGMASAASVDERSLKARMHWLERIRRALDEESFIVYCQPIARIDSGELSQFELLLRMQDENGQIVPATAFLATAERFDLIQEIDRWVVSRAIEILSEEQAAGREVVLCVNLSAKSVVDPALPAHIAGELRAHGADGRGLCFEVTETAAVVNIDRARHFASLVAEMGCEFALDDFGAGFASFYYLKHLAFDLLKIDGEFVTDLTTSRTNQLVVKAVVDIARGLGKRTIAEFVEDAETLELLRGMGVDFAQGFYVAKPAPLPLLQAALPHLEKA
jgi:EAL domain-containing protein (putative c-di-GMP-specific phosphodiesterase class I)